MPSRTSFATVAAPAPTQVEEPPVEIEVVLPRDMRGRAEALLRQHQRQVDRTADQVARERGEERQRKADAKLGFLEWAKRVPEPKTGALNFGRFPYQLELYQEGVEIPVLDLMKSTQVGASAWLVRWTLYWTDQGDTTLYIFPADEQLRSFYTSRIAPLLLTPYLAKRVADATVSNVHQREIGRVGDVGGGFLNLRGAQTVAGLETIDADEVAMDEYDLIPKEAIPVAERRISSPLSRGLIRRIGWPSVDGYGMAKRFEESDRRRWFVKCPACKTQQFLRFFPRTARTEEEEGDMLPNAPSGYVDVATARLLCGKCDKPLSPETVAKGEWVAEFPNRDNRGYHMHRLMVPGARLGALIAASQSTDEWEVQSFFNRDLGEPHSPKEGRLSPQAIAAAQSAGGEYLQGPWDTGATGDGLRTMGIDTASARNLNVRISQHDRDGVTKHALFIGEVEDWNKLGRMMDMYDVRMACVDHLPDGTLARAFAQRFYGRVYVAHFLPPTSKAAFDFDPQTRLAGVKRTDAIDATLGLVRSTKNRLPMDLPDGYVAQMRNVVRFHEIDEVGRRIVGYKSLGAIDYLMSEVYDFFATELAKAEKLEQSMSAETISHLDDHLVFERSDLNQLENTEWRPGFHGDMTEDEGEDEDWKTGYEEPL